MAKNIALKVARVEKNMTQKELAQAVGISRQTSVLAFQLGDGFSNSVLPMSSSLMGTSAEILPPLIIPSITTLRPIYYAITVSPDQFVKLDPYR